MHKQRIILPLVTVILLALSSLQVVAQSANTDDLIVLWQAFLDKNRCSLPCIVGLDVNQVTIEQAFEHFASYFEGVDLSRDLFVTESGETSDVLPFFFDPVGAVVFDFRSRTENVVSIRTQFTMPSFWMSEPQYALSETLTHLGIPDSAYISLHGIFPYPYAVITLVYNSQEVILEYQIAISNDLERETPISICPKWENILGLSIWIVEDSSTEILNELLDEVIFDQKVDGQFRRADWSLEQMVGIGEREFTELYNDTTSHCMVAPSYGELAEMGYMF
jgi:hypothetical protein